MAGVAEVAMATVIGGGGLASLYFSASALRSGKITNFFGQSNHDVYFSSNPIRFVGSVIAWACVGVFAAAFGVVIASSVPLLHWTLVPAYFGPLAAIWRLFQKRQPPLTLTTEVLVERVLAPETAAITADMVTDGPTRRLLALIADLPRDADAYRAGPDRTAVFAAIDQTERAERKRIVVRGSPAGLALLPPLLWIASGYVPNDGAAAWGAAVIAVVLGLAGALIVWRQVQGIGRVARVMRDRLQRPL
jgi:hypothetical protein